mgnify:CR=1 FL=1
MGYAERLNTKSEWNKKRTMNMSSNISSPISNSPVVSKVSIPAKDEPMVIQITPRSVFKLFKEFLCRMLKLTPGHQSPVPMS